MYTNPSALTFKSSHTIPPSILPFHKTLPDYAQTPLHRLPPSLSSTLSTGPIFLKDESHRFGLPAYKILGASWACYRAMMKQLNLSGTPCIEDVKKAASGKDVRFYTATDGNWGRAVARMGGMLGATARIYVPKVMLETTKEKIRSEDAEVVVVDGDYDLAVKKVEQACHASGGLLVADTAWPGYEEIPQWVVDAYSTMMVEIDEQVHAQTGKAPDLVVVPIGAGSLGQATVTHFKSKANTAILAVEPTTAACLKTSLEHNAPTSISTSDTAMCGMNCGTVSTLAWPILRDGVDAAITVGDEEAREAEERLRGMGLEVGPCAAATLGALVKARGEGGWGGLGIGDDAVVVLLGTEGPRGET